MRHENPYAAPQTERLARRRPSRVWRRVGDLIALILFALMFLVLAYIQ